MKSKIILRKHLLTLSLVIALGLAVFVNWYYTKQDKNISTPDVTEEANLGDAQFVNSNSVDSEDNYFTDAVISRTKAHDSAKDYLQEIIEDTDTDEDTKALAREKLVNISEYIKAESDMENLISAQIDNDCIVAYDGENVEVILPKGSVSEKNLVKIRDIILSKTSVDTNNITIIETK